MAVEACVRRGGRGRGRGRDKIEMASGRAADQLVGHDNAVAHGIGAVEVVELAGAGRAFDGVEVPGYAGAPLELVKAPRKEALCEKRLCGSHDGQTGVLVAIIADEPIGSPEVEQHERLSVVKHAAEELECFSPASDRERQRCAAFWS